jgi:glycine dehydrogenase subunit 2
VSEKLLPFLPVPVVIKKDGKFFWDNERPLSIGRVSGFHGNFLVVLRAYAYVRSLGACGLRHVAKDAVLNANYLLVRLKKLFTLPYNRSCMHEFVLSIDRFSDKGIGAMHIAKRLMDYGFHPPTVYFPIIVKEAMMIEPTETESKQTLDTFIQAMEDIVKEIETNPEIVLTAPHSTVVSRLDETLAARCPQVTAKI